MRRSAIQLLALGSIAVAVIPSLAGQKSRQVDKRLIGTWRSDKERTTRLWRYRNNLDAEKKVAFESIFGKMTKRFTATRAFSEFEGETVSGPYQVVAIDSKSVVISFPNAGKQELQQIFFEEDWFYIASGYNFEFFRRVDA